MNKRPILVLLTASWISMLGVALVTLAGFSWLFVLPLNTTGRVNNPYIGLLVFIAIPIVFFVGLAAHPHWHRSGEAQVVDNLNELEQRRKAWRRAGIFFGSDDSRERRNRQPVELSRRGAYGHRTVLRPDLPRDEARIHCSRRPRAPIRPWLARNATSPREHGLLKAKMDGTHQLMSVSFNNYPRPIESAMEDNKLVSSAETCEQCHAREKAISPRLRVFPHYKDDEANTRTDTVLLMHIGGGTVAGIHGAHLGPGVRIRYAAADKKRQTIPWVEYTNTRPAFRAPISRWVRRPIPSARCPLLKCNAWIATIALRTFLRPPDRAVNQAMANGEIAAALPYVKKNRSHC